MCSAGDSHDKVMAESFFASPAWERIDRCSWTSFAAPRMSVFTWIMGWYNTSQRHRSISQISHISFDKGLREKAKAFTSVIAELTADSEM